MAARAFLFVTAAVFFAFGLWGLWSPAEMLSRFGVELADPAGRTAIRAMYGGFLIGAGALFAFSALSSVRAQFGLQAVLIMSTAILSSRIFGIVVDGQLSAYHASYAALEVIGITVSAFLLLRSARRP